jgi:hypothetical protein
VPEPAKKLSYMAAYNNFKKLVRDMGLNEKLYALHSPRVGAATDAHLAGTPGNIIDFRGRWKSASTKKRYCRPDIDSLLLLNR